MGVGLWLMPAVSSAQSPTEPLAPFDIAAPPRDSRPYRGLFGGGTGKATQLLKLEAEFGGGISDSPLAGEGSTGTAAGLSSHGPTGTGTATLQYTLARSRFGLFANNAVFENYYPELPEHKLLPRDVFSGEFYFDPTQSTHFSVYQTFKNLPQLAFGDLFGPDQTVGLPAQQDFRVTLDRYMRYGTTAGVDQHLGRRTIASVSASWARGIVSTGKQWTILTYSGNVNYNLTKGIVAYVGGEYGGQRDETPGTVRLPRETHPRLNVGLSFTKPLSFSRRVLFVVSTGTAGTHDNQEKNTTYNLIGSARITREFGRTWETSFVAGRDVRYVEQYSAPLFNDSFSVIVRGSLNSRLQLRSSVGKSVGHLGASGGNAFASYFASSIVSYGLSRSLGIAADFTLYRYRMSTGPLAISTLGSQNNRTFRTYVQFALPLMTRTKAPTR